MKIRLFTLLFFFVLSSPSFACWEDEDTDYNQSWEDEWDIDGGELGNVIIEEETYWFIDDLDKYGYDEDSDNDNSWEDNDDDDGYACGENSFNYLRKEYFIKSNDVLVKKDLPLKWIKQDNKNTCVVTAMEYAEKIVTGINKYGRSYYESLYGSMYGVDVRMSGVRTDRFDTFFNEVFNVSYIYSVQSFYDMINRGYCILSTIDEGYTAHEIVIIGYTDDKSGLIGIDPWDGKLKEYSCYELKGVNYVIKGVK